MSNDESKLDRNLRILAGIINILGAAATTVMTIMQAEKKAQKGRAAKERRALTQGKSKGKGKKPAPKRKLASKKTASDKALLKLQSKAKDVLAEAKKLNGKEETK
jgi:hypothetical protein